MSRVFDSTLYKTNLDFLIICYCQNKDLYFFTTFTYTYNLRKNITNFILKTYVYHLKKKVSYTLI